MPFIALGAWRRREAQGHHFSTGGHPGLHWAVGVEAHVDQFHCFSLIHFSLTAYESDDTVHPAFAKALS